MKVEKKSLGLATLACMLVGSVAGLSACGGQKENPQNQASSHEKETPPNQSGLMVYIDPNTGEFVSEPPDGSIPQATSTLGDAEGPERPLQEIVGSDGTVTVILDGRFDTPLTAQVDCDGNVVVEHSHTQVDTMGNCDGKGANGEKQDK